jgi:hypothetical protein
MSHVYRKFGLNVITQDVAVERIFENNLIAQMVKIASEVALRLPSDPGEPMHPVCGLRYRIRGRRLFGDQDGGRFNFNPGQIEGPKRAFLRRVA